MASSPIVTLCEESVDWNHVVALGWLADTCHSLRGECGLKYYHLSASSHLSWSLSARRVWIEIVTAGSTRACPPSLSARRVWIEISVMVSYWLSRSVTLCEESVDWNRNVWLKRWARPCHSLRGECGLKSGLPKYLDRATWVTLCEESVDWNRPDCLCVPLWLVTLCEESVDWNKKWLKILIHELFVTLCEESVDWNVERYL